MASQPDDTGTTDLTYNLVSVLYHALQGAETYAVYAEDAADENNEEAATFFREIAAEEERRADRTKRLLADRLRDEPTA